MLEAVASRRKRQSVLPSKGRQALQFAGRLLVGADDADAGVPGKHRFILGQELKGPLSVALGDLRVAHPLGDPRLDQQDAELLDRKQAGRSGREALYAVRDDEEEVQRWLTYWVQGFRSGNHRTVKRLTRMFSLAGLALLFEIVLFALALALIG